MAKLSNAVANVVFANETTLKNQCRICLSSKGPVDQLFGKKSHLGMNLVDSLNSLCNINLFNHHKLPSGICVACCNKLNFMHTFCLHVIKSEKMLAETCSIVAPNIKKNNGQEAAEVAEKIIKNPNINIQKLTICNGVLSSDSESEPTDVFNDIKENKTQVKKESKFIQSNDGSYTIGVIDIDAEMNPQVKFEFKRPMEKVIEPVQKLLMKKSVLKRTVKVRACSKCKQEFPTMAMLRKHIYSKKCKNGAKIVLHTKEYLRHKKQHQEQRERDRQHCPECGIVKSSKFDLQAHMINDHKMRPEEDDNPFKCKNCLLQLPSCQELEQHECETAEYLTKSEPMNTSRKDYVIYLKVCNQCNATFKTDAECYKHIRNEHSIGRPKKCNLCDTFFIDKDSCLLHMAMIHNIKAKTVQQRKRTRGGLFAKPKSEVSTGIGDVIELDSD